MLVVVAGRRPAAATTAEPPFRVVHACAARHPTATVRARLRGLSRRLLRDGEAGEGAPIIRDRSKDVLQVVPRAREDRSAPRWQRDGDEEGMVANGGRPSGRESYR